MKIKNPSHICLCISAVIMIVALVMTLTGNGIRFGLDFAGGLSIQYDMGAAFEDAHVKAALDAQGVTDYTISHVGQDGHILQVRVPKLGDEAEIQTLQNGLEAELVQTYPAMDTQTATASYVGPVAGAVLVKNAVLSVLVASVLMLVYIAFRFDFASGLAAVIGLLHDVLIMLSFMVILRNVVQMNSSFIAAMLTIVGYSINNTIIIFDRIRENKKQPAFVGADRISVVKQSVRQSLGRTITTTLTTLATIVTLYLLGVDAIREFSLPIIVGILAGVYSANLINGYVWAWLEQLRLNRKNAQTNNA